MPPSWPSKNGHSAVVKLLLAKDGVDPDSKETVVKLLLAKEPVSLNDRDTKDGRTPLSLAVANRHEAVVKLLLENGVGLDK
jgi:ankyrin repeat protein